MQKNHPIDARLTRTPARHGVAARRAAGGRVSPHTGRSGSKRAPGPNEARIADLRVRPAQLTDEDRLVAIHEAAYPDDRSELERRRYLRANAWGTFADLRVVESERGIVGFGFLFSIAVFLGGRPVPAGGIASIAVAPEARRKGVARRLLEAMHGELDSVHRPLAFLYPFRESFYAQLGYTPTSRLIDLELSTAGLARLAYAGGTVGAGASPAAGIVALGAIDRARIAELYDVAARRTSGWLDRSASHWDARFSDPRRHWIGIEESSGKLGAYVAFSYDLPVHPVCRHERIVVSDFVAPSREHALRLLGFFASQRDQVDRVSFTVGASDPLLSLPLDGATSSAAIHRADEVAGHAAAPALLGRVKGGPMVRLIDARTALASRGYAEEGDLILDVADPLPEVLSKKSDGAAHGQLRRPALHLRVRRGRAAVVRPSWDRPEAMVHPRALGAIVAASLSPSEAAGLGELRARSRDVVARMDALFTLPSFQCLDPF